MTSIELFGCSGGMAEGFRRAGIEFTWVFDWSPEAVASYQANHGHKPVQMDVRDLVRMVRGGWSPGPVDLLVADPPCTPWSRAGKRQGTADERDMLEETAELIALLRPRAYLIGNVPGLDDSTNWPVVQRVLAPLAKIGYCIADFASLDAADYGVPQHRVRPFWFGHLRAPCIRWPSPTHGDPQKVSAPTLPGIASLKPWVTCRQALQHLPLEELGRPVRMNRRDPKHPACDPDAPATTVRSGGNGNAAPHVVLTTADRTRHKRPPSTKGPQWSRVNSVDAPSPTILTDSDRPSGSMVKLEWPWDRPGTVVHTEPRIAPPGHHGKSFMTDNRGHGPNAVVLSERAAALLQGFPDGWHFVGATKKARWAQIGMAMPPGLAEAVARSVDEQKTAAAMAVA